MAAGGAAGEGAFAAVVLAAGQGTRMRSTVPKMLHEAAGRPILEHVLRAVAPLEPTRVVVVVGHGSEEVRARFAGRGIEFVEQREQLGTAHAFLQSERVLGDLDGDLMVLNGDGPLLTTDSLRSLLRAPGEGDGMALLTCEIPHPEGYGRVVRNSGGAVSGIVEEKDANEAQRRIREINPGTYLFRRGAFARARRVGNDNAAGEYYLTDLVRIHLDEGLGVATAPCKSPDEALGVNTRAQLAEAERVLQERLRSAWMANGVTMLDPRTTYLHDTVTFGRDVVLGQGVVLEGRCQVADAARIGAYACLRDCVVAGGAAVPPHTVAVGESFST